MSSTDSKTIARRVLEDVFPADDEAALTQLVSENFVNHEAPPGTPPGPGSVTYFMHLLARCFTDQRWTIHQVLGEGDMVAIQCTHSGRHTGSEYFGIKATGQSFAYQQMHLIRIQDGKGVEHWAVRDDATHRRQLTGELPVGDPAPA